MDIPYDRAALRPRQAHIGFGAFARAHTLLYLDRSLRQSPSDWGAVAIRLNSGAEALSALDAAKGIYTVAEADGEGMRATQVGAVIATAHPARDGHAAVLRTLAGADLISLTITEKGYCLKEGRLDLSHPGIAADLQNPEAPCTAIGFLTAALALRHAAKEPGQTILSCDNLPMNGRLCATAVADFARARDPQLADWIAAECRFPCTMVDRIVPALDEAGRQTLRAQLGRDDPNGIVCEPFTQWVIEDSFAGPRPEWERAGAQIVADVAPYEEMKLRMLNGAHSFLAYLGALHGHATVADCMADPVFAEATGALMRDVQAPTLTGFDAATLADYAAALRARFANRALHHKLLQIAEDGSQKLPQRLLAPLAETLQTAPPPQLACLAIAGWLQFCAQSAARGDALKDPLADQITAIATRHAGTGPDFLREICAIEAIFPPDLAQNPQFSAGLAAAFAQISADGPRESLRRALTQEHAT